MKAQPIVKESELNEVSKEAQHILDLLDKIESHTIELIRKLMEELNKKS
jgi:hypothetical protein